MGTAGSLRLPPLLVACAWGRGREKELCETQAAFSLSCQPREHLQAAPKQPDTTWESSREQQQC